MPTKRKPKAKKGQAFGPPPQVKPKVCGQCNERPKVVGMFTCRPCHDHNQRCRPTVRRVSQSRRADRLAPVQERGREMTRNI